MEIILADINTPQVLEQIQDILFACDDEFLPPLSSRATTTQANLGSDISSNKNGPIEYLEGLKSQHLIVANIEGKICGFMSFRGMYEQQELGKFCPSNHITTVCVSPNSRGQGICRKFYEYMLTSLPEDLNAPNISTRTWSTNNSHLSLLNKLSFELVTQIDNDRGEGIHTVYYARSK